MLPAQHQIGLFHLLCLFTFKEEEELHCPEPCFPQHSLWLAAGIGMVVSPTPLSGGPPEGRELCPCHAMGVISVQLSSLLPFAQQTTRILILLYQYTFLLSSLVIVLPFKVSFIVRKV